MTKLKFKIKQGAKKRSHRNKVAKRRQQRDTVRVQEKKKEVEEKKDQDEFDQMLTEAQQNNNALQQQQLQSLPSSLLVGGSSSTNSRNDPSFRGVAAAPATKKKDPSHNMTRKQMKRKEKLRDKGTALAEQRVEKIMDKLTRVKTRARVRNSNLRN